MTRSTPLIPSCGAALLASVGLALWVASTPLQPAVADESHLQSLAADGAQVQVDLGEEAFNAGSAPILAWVRRSMDIVSGYYGRFPVTSLRIQLVARSGGGVITGKTWAMRGGFIRIQLGRDVTEAQLRNDWVLVHEMTHLALPDVGDEHQWLSEGLAVYVEGIARVQAGNRTVEDVFAEEFKSMPRGLPQPGDAGLDHTHTWGRTYWGGTLFCLLADVQIHQQTSNHSGLQDALRAVLDRSGGLQADWPISRVLDTGDAATGTRVLRDLYAQMKDRPVTPDLPRLWEQLGVHRQGDAVVLTDDAPLAAVRRAIMHSRASKTSS